MNTECVPIKTLEGQRELAEQRCALSSRSRALFISIQGSLTVQDIREQFAGLGNIDRMLRELERKGLIRLVDGLDAACSSMAVVSELAGPTATALHIAKQFMRTTAVAACGLRALLFAFSLDRRVTREGVEELLPRYHRLLAAAKGEVFAATMVRRIDYLLLQAEPLLHRQAQSGFGMRQPLPY